MWPQDCEVLCIPRFEEALYKKALLFAHENRKVVIFSKEKKKSDSPYVNIQYVRSDEELFLKAKKLASESVFKSFYVHQKGPFKEIFQSLHLVAEGVISDASDFWVHILHHAKANRSPHYRGTDLKGAFLNVPAVIVGAGPSLQTRQALLKDLSERALIFAAGSALNVLEVEPHFCGSVDPEAPYRQFKNHSFFETPFCYQSRMNKDNFSLLHGPKILFPDSHSEAINWIDEEESLFNAGWTVGTFLTSVALWMGCSPIFLVGMDLCYTDGRKYAKMDSFSEAKTLFARGKETQKDWLMAAHWMEAQKAPLFDLSQGILNLPKIDGKKALALCPLQRNLRWAVHEKLLTYSLKGPGRLEKWEESFKRCKEKVSEEEVVYQKLLLPLWQIWEPLLLKEAQGHNLQMHQHLFFQRILEEHERALLSK